MSFFDKRILWAIATIAIYTWFFHSIWPALLIAGAISWHESCHLMAAKKMGLRTRGFTLYPFIGGMALVDDYYRSYGQQAFVVLAGPVGGGLGAIATGLVYTLLKSVFHVDLPWLCAAAYWMAFINLFNFLPLSFMDGGQLMSTITYSINRTLGVFSFALSTIVAIVGLCLISPILGMFVAFFGGAQTANELMAWNSWRKGETWKCPDHWNNPPKNLSGFQMLEVIISWTVASIALVAMMMFLKKLDPDASNLLYFFKK